MAIEEGALLRQLVQAVREVVCENLDHLGKKTVTAQQHEQTSLTVKNMIVDRQRYAPLACNHGSTHELCLTVLAMRRMPECER